ncbi:winged helix-turn-helix domain-containing protein [Streptomyces sp. NPDC047968]|uniref:helix-turn-helix domain-containing protein n=1 Tax=unclassified Streptomyces TaxID=2593676 RepID=UPI00342353D3
MQISATLGARGPPVHPRGVSYPLHRLGWSPQVPAHRAAERDGRAVAVWRTEPWSRARGRGGSWARGWPSRARPGQGLKRDEGRMSGDMVGAGQVSAVKFTGGDPGVGGVVPEGMVGRGVEGGGLAALRADGQVEQVAVARPHRTPRCSSSPRWVAEGSTA